VRNAALRLAQAFARYGNPVGLGVARLLRRPLVRVVDRATGLEFRCRRGADRMFGEIFHAHLYDVPGVPLRPGDVAIDIGANHGFATCHFARQGARVLSFEPSPEVFPLLEENVARNRVQGRLRGDVRCDSRAIASQPTVELLVSPRLGGGMTTTSPTFARTTETPISARLTVPAIDLDSVLRSIPEPRIRLVKLDCEGAEESILGEISDEQRRRVDSWAIEIHPQAYDLGPFLERLIAWPGTHVSKVPELGVANANLFAVRADALVEGLGATSS
jgi:FkbM family methyltransferase